MRTRRIKADPDAPSGFYHCVSRVVDRRRIFGEVEKDYFLGLLRRLAGFCDVRVLTYCVMDNHFHLLIEVPRRPDSVPSDEELLARLGTIYSKSAISAFRRRLEILPVSERLSYRETFLRRMWDISEFLKELKQRFSQWYNKRHGRTGTLWEDRFRSVLVQPGSLLLAVIAAYIDLNPVRAGLVGDPASYRWNGFRAASAGNAVAIAGYHRIQELVHGHGFESSLALESYRLWLYATLQRRGLNRSASIRATGSPGSSLELEDMVIGRVRRFTYGLALGARAFIEALLLKNRHALGGVRARVPQAVPYLKGDLFSLRRIRPDGV